jgi:hypothetical protein
MPIMAMTTNIMTTNTGRMLPRVSRRKRRAWINRRAFMGAGVFVEGFLHDRR